MEQTNNLLPVQKSSSDLVLLKQSRPLLAKISEDFPKIRAIQDDAQTDSLMNYLITLLNLKVSNAEEIEDLQIQMLVIKDFMISKFGNLTIEEIKEAFKMYVAREFPQIKVFRMLDCVNTGEVLDAYIAFKSESLRIYSDKKSALLNAPTQPSDEEKRQIREKFLKGVFEDLVEDGFSIDAYQLFFNLERSEKLKATIDEKKALYTQELKKYIPAEKEEIKSKGGLAAKSLLADFQKRIDSGKPLTYVQNRCRSIMACEYLKNHLEDFETFKKAIENEEQL